MCPLTRPKAPPIGHVVSLLRGAGFQLLPGAPFKFAPCSRRPPASKKTGSRGNRSRRLGRLRHPRSRHHKLNLPEPASGEVPAVSYEIGTSGSSGAANDAPGPARHCATASALIHVSIERIA
jgi:hypothetical protein